MKEVRDRLNRDFKLENIGSLFQRKLTDLYLRSASPVSLDAVGQRAQRGSLS
jgi:hypothetical protein